MKSKVIALDIFKRGVLVFVGTKQELINSIDIDLQEQIKDSLDDYDNNTIAMTIETDTDAIIFCEQPITVETLLHECVHAARIILEKINAYPTDNDEVYAYLVEYLFKQAKNITCEVVSPLQ